jgi:ATP-dependent DNA ligase
VNAIASLPVKTYIIDGEAIVDQSGLSIFDLLRYRQHDHAATLCAFDLIELDGADLRRCPIEERKRHLALILRQPHQASRSMRHTIAMAPSSLSMLVRRHRHLRTISRMDLVRSVFLQLVHVK